MWCDIAALLHGTWWSLCFCRNPSPEGLDWAQFHNVTSANALQIRSTPSIEPDFYVDTANFWNVLKPNIERILESEWWKFTLTENVKSDLTILKTESRVSVVDCTGARFEPKFMGMDTDFLSLVVVRYMVSSQKKVPLFTQQKLSMCFIQREEIY